MPAPVRIALLLLASPALADPVFTEPVGLVKLGNTSGGGSPAVPANTDVWLSVPLERAVEFSGRVDHATETSITVEGDPGWLEDEWLVTSGSGAPYCVVVELPAEGDSTPASGIRAIIEGNSSDTLSLKLPYLGTGSAESLQSGERITIRRCWTISTLFENNTIPSGTQIRLFDETDAGINHVSSAGNRFTFNGSLWRAGNFTVGDDVVVRPGEAFVLRTGSNPIASLAISGDVPSAPLRMDLSKDGPGSIEDVEIAFSSPVPVSLQDLGLPVASGDQIQLIDNATAGINKTSSAANRITRTSGGSWLNGQFQPVAPGTFMIEPGTGFRLRRSATSPDIAEWNYFHPYTIDN